MIAACLRAKVPQLDEALQVFRSMLRNKLEVGVKTYLKLIDAFVDAPNLKAGDEVFSVMRSTGHQIYSKVYSLYCVISPKISEINYFQEMRTSLAVSN